MTISGQHETDDIAIAIRALGVLFFNKLPAAVTRMQLQLALLAQNVDDRDAWKALHLQLHTLAGSGGTFGYTELSTGSRALAQRVSALLKDTPQDSAVLIADLHDFMVWITNHHAAVQPDH